MKSRSIAALAAIALLSFFASGASGQPTIAPAAGSCYGNDVPNGMVGLLDPVTGNCWIEKGAPGAPGIVADNFEGTKATFSGSIVGLAPAATATDVFTICGSASKVVRVIRLDVSGIATAASTIDLLVIKRTTADTGGTSAAVTVGSSDTNDPAATATTLSYTANPAGLGTGAGIARAMKLSLPAAGGNQSAIYWTFGTGLDKAIVLRGAAQCLAVNLNGQAIPGGTNLDISATFTEE